MRWVRIFLPAHRLCNAAHLTLPCFAWAPPSPPQAAEREHEVIPFTRKLLYRTAGLEARIMSEPEARGPEDYEAVRMSSSAISRSLVRWILKPLGEGVLGKSAIAKTRTGTL